MPQRKPSSNEQISLSFGEIFDRYFYEHAVPKTRCPENARYIYRSHGIKWSQIPVVLITREKVQSWVDQVGATSGHAVANRAVNMMAAVINWGMRRSYLPQIENPCRYVERFKEKSRERFLQPGEIKLLSAALDEEPPLIHDLFWMCLWTGARRGNVQAMRWKDIDFDLRVWRIPITKNNESLYLPLCDGEVTLLERRKQLSGNHTYVFPGRGKKGYIADLRRSWKRIQERTGLTDLRIHDLRRTKGAYLAMQGTDGFLIAKALGHKDLRSTSVYARMNLVSVRRAVESVHAEWRTIIGDDKTMPSKSTKPNKMKLKIRRDSNKAVRYQRPKNASVKIIGKDQEKVEQRILKALTEKTQNKAGLYKRIGGLQVNALEMDRILEEMISQRRILKYQDDHHLHSWQYAVTTKKTLKISGIIARPQTKKR